MPVGYLFFPKPRLHDATCCQAGCHTVVQPGLTTGWTNSCLFNTVVKPVWQPAVSCKRGISESYQQGRFCITANKSSGTGKGNVVQ